MTIDGKTLRGTIPKGVSKGVHLLAAYLPEEGVILMQMAVDQKEIDIKAAPILLQKINLRDKVVRADAMLTQRKVSAFIVDAVGRLSLGCQGEPAPDAGRYTRSI